MKCAICMQVKTGEPFDAVTIRGGTAVCTHHVGYASDENVKREYGMLHIWGGAVTYKTDEDVIGEA